MCYGFVWNLSDIEYYQSNVLLDGQFFEPELFHVCV